MQRTDVHRPSFADPAEYTEVGYFDLHPEDGGGSIAEEYSDTDSFLGNFAQRGRCDHCGAGPLRYIVIFYHAPSQSLVTVGCRCANKLGLASRSEYEIRKAVEAERNLRILKAKLAEYTAAAPDVVEFLEGLAAELSAYHDAMEKANDDYEIEYLAARADDKPAPRFRGPKAPDSHPFLTDMIHSLHKWGGLTEKQEAAVRKFIAGREKFAAAKAEREASEPQPEGPLTEGRQQLTGEIVSTKFVDNDFGGALKMLVRLDDANKVWGTVPASLAELSIGHMTRDNPDDFNDVTHHEAIELKGQRITFKATVERSRDDEHFGFFSRPTGATLVEQVTA